MTERIFGHCVYDKEKKMSSEIREYACPYCKYKFKHYIRRVADVSTQVICPSCKNFVKTWGD